MSSVKGRMHLLEGKAENSNERAPKAFAGRKVLLSAMVGSSAETEHVQSSFSMVIAPGGIFDTDFQVEGRLKSIIGVPVTILPEGHPDKFVGMDEADRFIAGVEAAKKR